MIEQYGKTGRDYFLVNGSPAKVAPQLAKLISGGIENQFDMSKGDANQFAKLGINVEDILDSYTINSIDIHRGASEFVMALFGQLIGIRALVIGYKSKPTQSEVIPLYDGPISPDKVRDVGLEILTN